MIAWQVNHFGRQMTTVGAAVLLGAAALAAGQTSAKADETVVYAGWGGNIQEAQRRIIFDPFEKESGIKVIDVPGVNLAKVKAMVETGNVEWDVVQNNEQWVALGEKDGLWEELDYEAIDETGIPETLVQKYGLGVATFGVALAYNTTAFPEGKQPKSWADFWDIEKFPGRRGYYDQPKYMLEFALMADGVPLDKIYPIDADRAFKSLDRLKSSVHVWTKLPAGVPPLLASGEIVASPGSGARFILLRRAENAPLEVNWDQSIMQTDFLSVPKGSKNKSNAMKLVNFMSRPEIQAEVAKAVLAGPSNTKALDLLTEEDKKELPTFHYQAGEMLVFDGAWWAANQAGMEEKWQEWKLK